MTQGATPAPSTTAANQNNGDTVTPPKAHRRTLGVHMGGHARQFRGMSDRPRKRPTDANKLAKSIVDIATGDADEKRADAAKSQGGKKGAAKRAATLTPEQRSEIASIAATARWKKS